MTLNGALQYLRDTGWTPDAICDGPGRDALGRVTQPTLLGAAHWDKDPKHASCANHLRFYLSEFPILAPHERILFVDDDVVIQQVLALPRTKRLHGELLRPCHHADNLFSCRVRTR